MKPLLLYFCFSLISIYFISAQTVIAEYERVSINTYSEEDEQKYIKLMGKEQYDKMMEFTSKPSYYILDYSQGISEFKEKPFEDKEESYEMGGIKMNMTIIADEDVWYKDFNSNQLISNEYIMHRAFLMEESMQNLDWQIQEETQEFGDFTAQKATLEKDGKEIIAYYTEEIPIPDGPHLYYGLPGLIVYLKTQNHEYSLNSLQITQENSSFDKPTKGKEMDRVAFEKLKKEKMKDGVTIIEHKTIN